MLNIFKQQQSELVALEQNEKISPTREKKESNVIKLNRDEKELLKSELKNVQINKDILQSRLRNSENINKRMGEKLINIHERFSYIIKVDYQMALNHNSIDRNAITIKDDDDYSDIADKIIKMMDGMIINRKQSNPENYGYQYIIKKSKDTIDNFNIKLTEAKKIIESNFKKELLEKEENNNELKNLLSESNELNATYDLSLKIQSDLTKELLTSLDKKNTEILELKKEIEIINKTIKSSIEDDVSKNKDVAITKENDENALNNIKKNISEEKLVEKEIQIKNEISFKEKTNIESITLKQEDISSILDIKIDEPTPYNEFKKMIRNGISNSFEELNINKTINCLIIPYNGEKFHNIEKDYIYFIGKETTYENLRKFMTDLLKINSDTGICIAEERKSTHLIFEDVFTKKRLYYCYSEFIQALRNDAIPIWKGINSLNCSYGTYEDLCRKGISSWIDWKLGNNRRTGIKYSNVIMAKFLV